MVQRRGVLLARSQPWRSLATPSQAAAPGDATRGKVVSYTCLGCHCIDGYKNAYPNYSVPALRGQHPEYIATALHGYRDGDRAHLTMHSEASTLSEQDIADIASLLRPASRSPPAARPRRMCLAAAALCSACHGADGVSLTPLYPVPGRPARGLPAGAPCKEYAKGGRKNPIMKGFAAGLKGCGHGGHRALLQPAAARAEEASRARTRPWAK